MTDSDIFDRIAPGWYGFRHHSLFTRELEALAARWRGGRLLNIGCAHGPDFPPFCQGFTLYGLDFSRGMLLQAQRYARKFDLEVNLSQGDACALPYRAASFEWAIAVASYHHLTDRATQQIALGELRRVLRPGGEAFITVWNRHQPRFWFRPARVQVAWKAGSDLLKRDYYLFRRAELERLVRQAGFKILSSSGESRRQAKWQLFSRNICLVVSKV